MYIPGLGRYILIRIKCKSSMCIYLNSLYLILVSYFVVEAFVVANSNNIRK